MKLEQVELVERHQCEGVRKKDKEVRKNGEFVPRPIRPADRIPIRVGPAVYGNVITISRRRLAGKPDRTLDIGGCRSGRGSRTLRHLEREVGDEDEVPKQQFYSSPDET